MKKLLNTLYITSPDRYLSLDGENVVVNENEQVVGRVPLHNLDGIVTFGYTGVSPALMSKCAKNGIDICFMSSNGKFLCRTQGEVSGNVLLRRQQYRLADDKTVSLEIARNMIAGKIFNSRWACKKSRKTYNNSPESVQKIFATKCTSQRVIDFL